MSLKILKILLIFMLFSLPACSFISLGYEDKVPLPEGTRVEVAQKIVYAILTSDDFGKNLVQRFPKLDFSRQQVIVKWVEFSPSTPVGAKKQVWIGIVFRFKGKPSYDPKEVVDYAKILVQNKIDDYFKNNT